MNLTISGKVGFNCSKCPHSKSAYFYQRPVSLINTNLVIQNNKISNKQNWEMFFCLKKRRYHSELYVCKRMKYLNKLLKYIGWIKRFIWLMLNIIHVEFDY